jgi:hypothetical protein
LLIFGFTVAEKTLVSESMTFRSDSVGQVDGEYLYKMEDVLRVYEQEPQAQSSAVVEPAVVEPAVVEPAVVRLCFDERPCQLLDEVLAPLPLKQGKPLRQDYEYERKGTACVLLAYDLDKGQRYVQVRERRTKKDYAQFVAYTT